MLQLRTKEFRPHDITEFLYKERKFSQGNNTDKV